MKKKWVQWSALLACVCFATLFWLWWSTTQQDSELAPQKEVKAQKESQTGKITASTSQEKIAPKAKVKAPKKESPDGVTRHEQFMQELDKLEMRVHEQATECEDQIKGKLSDHNFIDPKSDFYQNGDKIEALLLDTVVTMGASNAEMANWEISNYIQRNDPLNIEYLIELHDQFQETCLLSSAITFIQTTIESCRYKCPPRLERVIGNILFDGFRMMMANHSGAKRVLLTLSFMETANRYGPYHIAMDGEIEDLRFRVQKNYELYQEELQQNKGKPERQAQAFRSFIQENEFLKDEVLELLLTAAERHFP